MNAELLDIDWKKAFDGFDILCVTFFHSNYIHLRDISRVLGIIIIRFIFKEIPIGYIYAVIHVRTYVQ